MSDPPSESVPVSTVVSRRRRIVIGAVIAVLLVGGGWWISRPAIDPRLVGRWSVEMGGTTWPIPIYELSSSGNGTIWSPVDQQNSSYEATPISWRIEGNSLFWKRKPDSFRHAMYVARDRMLSWLGRPAKYTIQENVFEIVEVERDDIQLDVIYPDATTSRWIFTRSAE